MQTEETPKRIEQAARERAELDARVPELDRQWERAVYDGDDEAAQRLARERREARDALADLERRCEVLRQRRRDEMAEAERREAETAADMAAGELRELESQFGRAMEAMEAAEEAIGAISEARVSDWYKAGQRAALGGAGVREPSIASPRELIDRIGKASVRLSDMQTRVRNRYGGLCEQAGKADEAVAKRAQEAEAMEWRKATEGVDHE